MSVYAGEEFGPVPLGGLLGFLFPAILKGEAEEEGRSDGPALPKLETGMLPKAVAWAGLAVVTAAGRVGAASLLVGVVATELVVAALASGVEAWTVEVLAAGA